MWCRTTLIHEDLELGLLLLQAAREQSWGRGLLLLPCVLRAELFSRTKTSALGCSAGGWWGSESLFGAGVWQPAVSSSTGDGEALFKVLLPSGRR